MRSVENIAAAAISIFLEMGIVSKLGFFTTDNTTVNDRTVRLILTILRPDILQPEKRRVRCLGHIINLAAQAFSSPEIANRLRKRSLSISALFSVIEAELTLWRKRGSLGELHNIITFIRRTPQRREDFQRCCKVYGAEILSSKAFVDFPRGLGILGIMVIQ